MHRNQLSLPGFPKPAADTLPLKTKEGRRPSLEKRIRGVEDRILNLELEVTLMGEHVKRLEEDEDE